MTFRVGIDLGGTKIEAILLDAEGNELRRLRRPTPRDDYSGTVMAISDLVHQVQQGITLRATVGVGIPGTISPATGVVKNANSTWLIGQPFDRDLASALGQPVRMANDANCFAVSEATDGAAAGAKVVFGVILGTGVGAGIAIDGRVLYGANAIAGEWGHNPLPWPTVEELTSAHTCYCGQQGCIETWLSGPASARDHERVTGEPLLSQFIVERAAEGDARAIATLERYEGRLARSLASMINVLDPDVIVLGGGMGNIGRIYENVPKMWGRWCFSDQVVTKLVPPKYGDSSGVRGAAWLWGKDELGKI